MHSAEAPFGTGTAESVARYFAAPNSPMASAHFTADDDSVTQSVRAGDTAWAAPGANADGVHIEHAGYAKSSRGEWMAHESMLNLSALVAAEVVKVLAGFGRTIPLRRLSVESIRKGELGFCGHIDVTNAYKKSTHTDPGVNFPWDIWLPKVAWWLPHIDHYDFR